MEGKQKEVEKEWKQKRIQVQDGRKRGKKMTKNQMKIRNTGVWMWDQMRKKTNVNERDGRKRKENIKNNIRNTESKVYIMRRKNKDMPCRRK